MAFGDEANATVLEQLQQEYSQGDFSSLPEIEVRSRKELAGANGAYGIETDKIYLAREFLAEANTEDIAALLLEEIGHGIDRRINDVDSNGDEGYIFSSLVRGVELSDTEIASLQNEDDTATIILDGQLI